MNPLEHLSRLRSDQWPQLRRRALADGRGCVLDPECERAAAAEELVALTLPELPSLGVLAMLAECRSEPCRECARALSHGAAGVLRLVDGALAAHGRDHGYPVTAWLEHAFEHAHGVRLGRRAPDLDESPASTLAWWPRRRAGGRRHGAAPRPARRAGGAGGRARLAARPVRRRRSAGGLSDGAPSDRDRATPAPGGRRPWPRARRVRSGVGAYGRGRQAMTERRRPDEPEREPPARPSIDAELLARAAEINEAVAGEFAEQAVSPLENPLIARMAELGVETEAAVSVALQRAHRIAFDMRRGRMPRDAAELGADARELSPDERAQVAALAVAWWDGVLTALRAAELARRRHEP